MTGRVVVSLPATARKGELVEVKTLAGHPMETGFRRTQTGELIARDIITRFSCSYNGEEVFSAELHPAVSANPLLSFTLLATESGTLEFRWSGDNGFTASHSAKLSVV
jgi:sulfur-oxidizing protein SoxZ